MTIAKCRHILGAPGVCGVTALAGADADCVVPIQSGSVRSAAAGAHRRSSFPGEGKLAIVAQGDTDQALVTRF